MKRTLQLVKRTLQSIFHTHRSVFRSTAVGINFYTIDNSIIIQPKTTPLLETAWESSGNSPTETPNYGYNVVEIPELPPHHFLKGSCFRSCWRTVYGIKINSHSCTYTYMFTVHCVVYTAYTRVKWSFRNEAYTCFSIHFWSISHFTQSFLCVFFPILPE